MTTPNPYNPPTTQHLSYQSSLTTSDSEHLRILSICWYVISGLACFGACIGIIYPVMGLFFLLAQPHSSGGDPPATFVGIIFIAVGIFILLLSALIAYLYYLVGRSLKERKRLTLIYIMSGLICLSIPLGTILGIFTFIVLNRPTVKAAFK